MWSFLWDKTKNFWVSNKYLKNFTLKQSFYQVLIPFLKEQWSKLWRIPCKKTVAKKINSMTPHMESKDHFASLFEDIEKIIIVYTVMFTLLEEN